MFKCKKCKASRLFHFKKGRGGWRLHFLGLVISHINGQHGGWYLQHQLIYRQ